MNVSADSSVHRGIYFIVLLRHEVQHCTSEESHYIHMA
jgi:hypothetical protein